MSTENFDEMCCMCTCARVRVPARGGARTHTHAYALACARRPAVVHYRAGRPIPSWLIDDEPLMLVLPQKQCTHPGCRALTAGGRRFCDKHHRTWIRSTDYERLRGRRAVTRRERLLRSSPLCVVCHAAGRVTLGVEVDHVVPLSRGGSDDETNLQVLCRGCHADKTKAEAQVGGVVTNN